MICDPNMNFQDQNPPDLIAQCINLVQKLRHGVGQVFKELSDGISDCGEETEKEETDSSNSKNESSKETKIASQIQKDAAVSGGEKEEYQDKHRAILRTLKKSLETISHDFSDLEKTGSTICPVQPFSNIDNLSLDPVDKNTVMHSQLLQAYKWTNKMHELANQAVSVLSQNSLKRTNSPKFTSSKILKGNMHAACYVTPASVDQLIVSLSQTYKDMGMDITISRPLGSSGIVQIELRRVLRVIVILRGLMIEWVKVKGIDETFETDDRQIDIWSNSRYQVFQKITDHAVAASLHYYAPAKPDLAIKSYLLWLQGYVSLFSAPCHKCGKYLQNNLPPTWRDFRSREPFHDVCRM
uniref:Mediator of RNA polymerase II transcription subunit 27 n=1 Tax=Arion vulgaris TaxID=1028688 RepID=A0A0B6Z9V2_9EUPU